MVFEVMAGVTLKLSGGSHIPPSVAPELEGRPPFFLFKKGVNLCFELGSILEEDLIVTLVVDDYEMGGPITVVNPKPVAVKEQPGGYLLSRGGTVVISDRYNDTEVIQPLQIGNLPIHPLIDRGYMTLVLKKRNGDRACYSIRYYMLPN